MTLLPNKAIALLAFFLIAHSAGLEAAENPGSEKADVSVEREADGKSGESNNSANWGAVSSCCEILLKPRLIIARRFLRGMNKSLGDDFCYISSEWRPIKSTSWEMSIKRTAWEIAVSQCGAVDGPLHYQPPKQHYARDDQSIEAVFARMHQEHERTMRSAEYWNGVQCGETLVRASHVLIDLEIQLRQDHLRKLAMDRQLGRRSVMSWSLNLALRELLSEASLLLSRYDPDSVRIRQHYSELLDQHEREKTRRCRVRLDAP